MTLPSQKQYDVIINGGGPVGTGLAIELGQRGLSVALVERHTQPQPIPKGQNLTQRTAEHFHFWNCEAELRAAHPIPEDGGIGGMTSYGTLLSGYNYDWLNRALVQKYYFRANARLPQYATEGVLRARAAELPNIDCLYGWSGTALAQDDTGVTLTITEHDGTAQRKLRGAWLVGADGSHSMVREAAGITQSSSSHAKQMALVVFTSCELHALLKRFPGKAFYNVLHPDFEGYWQFFGRVDHGRTWFFHAPVPLGTTAGNFDFKAYVRRAVGESFPLELDYVGFWDLRVAMAESYRAGRVFVAGDAAHSHPPYGGYGINTGLEDAVNLGWKLAASCKGWGGEALLDSYDAERRPVFASTARDFIERFITEDRQFLETHDPETDRAGFERAWASRNLDAAEVNAFEPNYEGSPIMPPSAASPSARGEHRCHPRSGHHLSPTLLSDGGNSFDVLGPDFTLLALDADEGDVGRIEDAARQIGLPLTVHRESGGPARGNYGVALVLVRPDQFVAWTGDSIAPQDASRVLQRAAGHLAPA